MQLTITKTKIGKRELSKIEKKVDLNTIEIVLKRKQKELRGIYKNYGFAHPIDFIREFKKVNNIRPNYTSKLGGKKIEIINAIKENKKITEIAAQFEVSLPTVYRIKHQIDGEAAG